MLICIKFLNFITFCSSIFNIRKYLHIYQLKDYNNTRFFKYFSKIQWFFMIFCAFLVVFQLIVKNLLFVFISDIVVLLLNLLVCSKMISTKKTPLKFTNKIIRLFIISLTLSLFLATTKYGVILITILSFFSPIISNYINIYDRIKNHLFIRRARKKLHSSKAKVIAITGSNGKTSVKNILLKMLSTKYNTLATPKSYNTPLGISKFINENLSDTTEYIILEYGARNKRDISKLCKLFGADIGAVTTIAPQHLASFKTVENILIAKSALPEFLEKKLCVFNIDNLYTYRMYQNKQNKKISTSIYTHSDIYASNIYIEDFITKFTLNIRDKKYTASTKLLGNHNVANITLCTAIALSLGVPIDSILNAIETLDFTPHRLELIRGRINILDDSYNCSLSSAKEAINALTQFPNTKMIATPGIIEGGKNESCINTELGKMCSLADYVVIIGEHNKKAILSGLDRMQYPKNHIFETTSLEQAKEKFLLLNDGDTLLLLNDLPDDYK